jgi:hypothetical protein
MAVVYGATPAKSMFPKTIPGLKIWLDANDGSTLFDSSVGGNIITSNGAAIGRWEDKSGNNKHATQSSAGVRPTLSLNLQNNLNLIRFDSPKYFGQIDTSSATSAFIICVFKIDNDPPSATTYTGHPFAGETNANSHLPWIDGIIYDAAFTDSRKTTNNPANSLTSFTMYSVESQANSWISKINSNLFYTTNTNTFQNTSLFSNNLAYLMQGYIGEIISYSPIPSVADIIKIQNYLNNKWKVY